MSLIQEGLGSLNKNKQAAFGKLSELINNGLPVDLY